MKKANKGLIVSLFEWIGFSWSKVRWQTNVAVLLLDFLHKWLIMVKKSMVKTIGKTTMEIDLMIARFNYIFDSCNMGTSDLPDMYAQSPRAAGPRAEGIHIRQITSAHVTTIM